MVIRAVTATLCALFVSSQATARPADCLLVVSGKTIINGPCDFTPVGKSGAFQIATTFADGRMKYFAVVRVDGSSASAAWNEEMGASHAHSEIGEISRSGACWKNSAAQICAWKPGERR